MSSNVSSKDTVLPGSPGRIEQLEKRSRILEFVLYTGLVFVVGSSVFWAWVLNNRVNELDQLIVSVSDVEVIGPTNLCPGEILSYRYVLHTTQIEDGVIEVDATIWSLEPPQTAIYSIPTRAIIDGASTIPVVEKWEIPTMRLIYQVTDLSPGRYQRRLSFRNLYQAEIPAVVRIPFTIREDCPDSTEGG